MRAAPVYADKLDWAVVPLHSAVAGVCSCAKGADCPSAGKHPRIKDWETEATTDAAQVSEWAQRWPSGNVGVATGAPSGFWVLDIDGSRGQESLERLEAEHGELPETVTQRTGSGGTHYLFALPEGGSVGNSASKIAPGIDVRGDGGQIVVAPSVSAKGAYSWVLAPWEYEVAPAPAWLLERLRAKPAPAPTPVATTPEGEFPPATPELLTRARDALEGHGPAVEGSGGDEHTFRAAAILTHDFALTDDEAWPLLVAWNATCQPPWSTDDLAAKLANGAKYGSKARGCARAPEALAMGRALIQEWAVSGSTDAGVLVRALEHVLAIASATDWPQLERDFQASTGFKLKSLGATPPVSFATPPPGTITLTTSLAEVADQATKVLAPHVFARNGVLCEVVRAERTFLSDVVPPRVVDLLSRETKWVRHDTKGNLTATTPPDQIAQIVCARRTHEGVRVIESVTTAPVFLPDGSILQTRGYNAQARVYLEPNVAVFVDDEPTLADARAAVAKFEDLLCDFSFASPADFSAWLAGLLSPLVKAATGNAPVPLIAVSASSPGAGKTLLTNVAALIITGAGAEVRPYNPRDAGEWGKRLTAFVRGAAPISVFDNVNGSFGDEALDRLLTSATWADRILGASDAPPIPIVTTWWATGNNIEPQGDTVRRVLPVRIVVDTERPQERSGFAIKDLELHAREHRSDYLSAALTILRAYHVAGRPSADLPSWGSFAAWSSLVRGALVWAGCVDPFETQARASREWNEPDTEAHDFWLAVVQESDGSVASIVTTANQRDAQGVLGVRESITPFTLRRFIHRFVDRPRNGTRIVRDRSNNATRYYVAAIT